MRNAENVLLSDILSVNNALDGIRIEADGIGETASADVSSAMTTGNRNGIRFYARNDASLSASVTSSVISGNSEHRMIVYDDSSAGSVTADLGGGVRGSVGLNSFAGNGLEDIAFDTDGGALAAAHNWWGQAEGPLGREIYRGGPVNDGLVGNWTFDQDWVAGNIVFDRSGYGHDGTLVNGAGTAGGELNLESSFLQYVEIPDFQESDNGDKLTLIYRIRPNQLANAQTVLTKWEYINGGYQNTFGVKALNIDPTEFYALFAEAGDLGDNYFATSNADLVSGIWAHIAVVYDGSAISNSNRLKIFKDASQLNGTFAGDIPATLNNSGEALRIGYPIVMNPLYGSFFDGQIDDVRIYNRALSSSEIAEIYRMDASGTLLSGDALASAP